MEEGQKRVVAKSVHSQVNDNSKRELWATVCYYYPQYDLQSASQLPVRDIKLLLKVAEKLNAKGSGVKQLTDYFRKQMQ